MRTALFPGSFDPFTMAHLDILDRSAALFGRVVIAVLENPHKQPLFSVAERVDMIKESVADRQGVEVGTFDGLTVDYARRVGASVIVRGLRAVSDFENEFQMALMNRRLYPELQTVFIPTSLRYLFLGSSVIKDVCARGGNIAEFVPSPVAQRLSERLRQQGRVP